MSRLRQLSDEVKTLSEQMVETATVEARARELRKADLELSEQVEKLTPLVESLGVLRSVPEIRHQVESLSAPRSLTEEISKTRRNAAKAGDRMIEDAAIDLSSLRSKLGNWRSSLAEMSGAWQSFVKARFEPMDKGLLDALESCGYQQSHVKALRECGAAINNSCHRPPRSRANLDAFLTDIREYQKRLADLGAPQAVHKFLVDAVGGGASLAALTPEVRTWLETNRLEPNFQIKVRQAGFVRHGGSR